MPNNRNIDRIIENKDALSDIFKILSLEHDVETMLDSFMEKLLSISWLKIKAEGGVFLVKDKKDTLELASRKYLHPNLHSICSQVKFGHCLCGMAAANKETYHTTCMDEKHVNRFDGMKPHGHYNIPIVKNNDVLGLVVLYLEDGKESDPDEVQFLEDAVSVLGTVLEGKIAQEKHEAILRRKEKELERSNKELENFAFIASHDMKTPLRHISLCGELISKELELEDNEEIQGYITTMKNSSERLSSMIDNLLEYARIQKPDENTQDDINLNDIIKNVLHDLQPEIGHKQAEIHIDDLPDIRGDDILVSRLFLNLIQNALKYARDDVTPEIKITYTKTANHHLIAFSDNGIGIEKKYKHKIFEIFTRLHRDNEYSGIGIGLPTCRRIIETLGGRIELDTDYSGGARFLCRFPV